MYLSFPAGTVKHPADKDVILRRMRPDGSARADVVACVANLVDFKMGLPAAVEAPRFTKMTFAGRDVMMENGVPADVRAELAAKGHEITLLGTFSGTVGGSRAVRRDFATGVNFGASDPRKDGAAIPEPVKGRK